MIFMNEANVEKKMFMTREGVFCYLVMILRLTNSGVIYTWMVAKLLKFAIGQTMEAYVDDMIIKSKHFTTHAKYLEGIF
ncbi:unnamed protein product [Cuscuta epithymum]|uniref:Reverse transcriptase Ty1/copia-type domain-containing protein n=1 Tax=Cuscuta epithymum TaxID=186058 RepID=A0AAV0DHT1_9ASTE|nr:unnamed protein product [Cuscuta epithymum]